MLERSKFAGPGGYLTCPGQTWYFAAGENGQFERKMVVGTQDFSRGELIPATPSYFPPVGTGVGEPLSQTGIPRDGLGRA